MISIPRYPFVVTVRRRQGGPRPEFQQYAFETIGASVVAAEAHIKHSDVAKVTLSVILQEWTQPEIIRPVNRFGR